MTLAITQWRGLRATKGERAALTWPDLVAWLGTPASRRPKAELPGWSPATFTADTRRGDAVERVSALVLDVDQPTTADVIERAISGLDAVAHVTPSATATAPRWRVVLRVSRPMSTDEHAAAWAHAHDRMARHGVVVDSATRDAGRYWYAPAEPVDGSAYEWIAIEGDPLDVDAIVSASALPDPAPSIPSASASPTPTAPPPVARPSEPDWLAAISMSTRVRRAREYVATCEPAVSGDRGHDVAMRVATTIVRGFALDGADALDVLSGWSSRCDPPWSAAELQHKVDEASRVGALDRGEKLRPAETAATAPPAKTQRPRLRRLAEALPASVERMIRRADGREKPIALPWPVLAPHFGGGLWPGLHIVNAGTGVGKTQLAMQIGAFAAKAGTPVHYLGLELGELDLALRLLGNEARVPWSHLWTGKAGPAYVDRARGAVGALSALPFFFEVARPHGFPASEIIECAEALRSEHPETDGPGSRPVLMIVDFLQLVGDEPDESRELRARIGAASYALRDIANRLGFVVLAISSIARERYKLMSELHEVARLAWEVDADGCPVVRRILDRDAIVGAGKESGDIEFSADSVSVLARVAETWDGTGCDVIFATAKGRATGETWSPLHFSGFSYSECTDRGGRILAAWNDASEARERAKDERRATKEAAKLTAITADADAVRAYVATHPGCSVGEARMQAVGDSSRRWIAALHRIGKDLVQRKDGRRIGLHLEGGADAAT